MSNKNVIDYLEGLAKCSERLKKVIESNGSNPNVIGMEHVSYVQGYLSAAEVWANSLKQEATSKKEGSE
jgi:hypothetical protein